MGESGHSPLPPRFPGTAGNAKLAPKPGTAGGSCKCWCLANLWRTSKWWSLVTCKILGLKMRISYCCWKKSGDHQPRVLIITASPMFPLPESPNSWDLRTFQPFPVAAPGVAKVQALKRRLLGIASQFECDKKNGHMKNFVYKEYIASDDFIHQQWYLHHLRCVLFLVSCNSFLRIVTICNNHNND